MHAPAARLGYGLHEDGLQRALACVQIQFHGLFKPALDSVDLPLDLTA